MSTTVVVHWDMCVQCGRHICSGAYANNVKCMCSSVHGHVVDCGEVIQGFYTDIIMLKANMK